MRDIGATGRRILSALVFLALFVVYLALLVVLFVARIAPFVVKVLCVGAWIVTIFVTGYAVWQLFGTVSPQDTWENAVLGGAAALFVAMIPLDTIFTGQMFGRCAAAAVVGVGLTVAAQWLGHFPEWFWIVRLTPNILSVSLVVMLVKDSHHLVVE